MIMKEKEKVYISLPISGRDLTRVRKEAEIIRGHLENAGYSAVTPFDVYAGPHPGYADYMASDIRLIFDCDAVCFAWDWQESKGCRLERAAAEIYGKKIMAQAKNGDIL